ncbi:hypothetical protein OPT61_g9015 [Boeremia exigua]|uniref:Uncharacterized protein n=1 Tax=Boeremia exigua TaxID=749465 RepID=A0ACC2HXJ0_9PLEO|nr:hypothetical protein OPT61_g9015 [Boeremia exigua]
MNARLPEILVSEPFFPSLNTSSADTQLSPAPCAQPESAPTSRKRKVTDLNLTIVTIDPFYDLTLIVGTPEHANGQMAFRVSKSSMRHVSDVWTKMLTGVWIESELEEIDLPDDLWKPFHIVLQIAHLQAAELPETLNVLELYKLAELTDKYNLSKAVRLGLDLKQWLHKHKKIWTTWPSTHNTQFFAIMASIFQYDSDLSFITNKIAVELQVDEKELHLYYESGGTKTKLSPRLPDKVLGNIVGLRNRLLRILITCCKRAIANVSKHDVKPPCNRAECAVTKAGILLVELTTAGLCPIPVDTKGLRRNVLSYWKSIKHVGNPYRAYKPCDRTYGYGNHVNSTGCCFEQCFNDFGLVTMTETMLQKELHADVFSYLQAVSQPENVADPAKASRSLLIDGLPLKEAPRSFACEERLCQRGQSGFVVWRTTVWTRGQCKGIPGRSA